MPISISNKRAIFITMGDPSGIGPEVALKALASREVSRLADFLLIGDRSIIEKTKRDLRIKTDVPVLDLANVPAANFSYGLSQPSYGRASIEYIDKAFELLDSGSGTALVTAPVNKASIRAAGIKDFEGHTEYLAKKTEVKDLSMMFVGKGLKIVLVTRHVAFKKVSAVLSIPLIYKTILTTHKYMRKFFKIRNPRIGVLGLNPHAGENGVFGREEIDTILPAILKASQRFKGIKGPLVPDVAFYDALAKRYDVLVAMYHDQGLIPFKTLYFEDGVNLTLGLPFIRTSPDHGTAFDIAGKGIADPQSMIAAIKLALRLTQC